MLKTDVLKHFKGRAVDVALACGITSAAVSQWDEVIPERAALRLERATKRKLKYDPELYIKTPAA